jgi:hypothetical protein
MDHRAAPLHTGIATELTRGGVARAGETILETCILIRQLSVIMDRKYNLMQCISIWTFRKNRNNLWMQIKFEKKPIDANWSWKHDGSRRNIFSPTD